MADTAAGYVVATLTWEVLSGLSGARDGAVLKPSELAVQPRQPRSPTGRLHQPGQRQPLNLFLHPTLATRTSKNLKLETCIQDTTGNSKLQIHLLLYCDKVLLAFLFVSVPFG